MKCNVIMSLFVLVFMFISSAKGAEVLMTFQHESGGFAGSYSMTTTDGTVWESNAPTFSDFYNMTKIFDGVHQDYLGDYLATYIPQSGGYLKVTFLTPVYITRIVTYPSAWTDHWSDSILSVSGDGINFTALGTIISSTHVGDGDYHQDYGVNQFVKSIQYDITAHGYTFFNITEAEFYTSSPVAVPEPLSIIMVGLGIVGLIKRKK